MVRCGRISTHPAHRIYRTYAEDALLANQLDQGIADAALAVALSIGLEVAEITNVALLVCWGSVSLAEWVDCVYQYMLCIRRASCLQ